MDEEVLEQQLTELGRVIVEEARTFLNFTFGPTRFISYQGSLFVILGLSGLVLGALIFITAATKSLLTGFMKFT